MAKKEGKKRLDFLWEFMKTHKMQGFDTARKLDITRRRWGSFKEIDSMMLSEAERVAALKGYQLVVSYGKNKKLREANIANEIYYRSQLVESERLQFITDTLKYHSVSVRQLTEMGVHYRTIRQCLLKNDIRIPLIYKIAEILKVSVRFKFVPFVQEKVTIPPDKKTV